MFQTTKYLVLFMFLSLVLAMSACKGKEDKDEHVFSGHARALEKAKKVQGILTEREKQNRQKIEDSFR